MDKNKKEHQFKVRFPLLVWSDLEYVAQDQERSINWIIVQAIREYIARHKKKGMELQEQEDV